MSAQAERPAWNVIQRAGGREADIQLPRAGAGMYVRYLADGSVQVAHWDRPEDADEAMRKAGIQ